MVDRSLMRLGGLYTREQLLPTPHLDSLDDLLLKPTHPSLTTTHPSTPDSRLKIEEILREIEVKLQEILTSSSSSAHWGFSLAPRVWGCTLKDEHIREDLQKIARTAMETESQVPFS